MADITLNAAPILGGIDKIIGENRIVERDDLALVSIACPLNDDGNLAALIREHWSIDMPTATLTTTHNDTRAVRLTPDQIMLIFPHNTPDAEAFVQKKLTGAGYTTDQTDAWVALEISGPDTRAAMERICPLDLSQFANDDAGRTVMEHMGALVIRCDTDNFLLFSASSSAHSFLNAVETSYLYVI